MQCQFQATPHFRILGKIFFKKTIILFYETELQLGDDSGLNPAEALQSLQDTPALHFTRLGKIKEYFIT